MPGAVNEDGTTQSGSLADDIVREGARRMLAAALEAEVDLRIAGLVGERDEAGRCLVVCVFKLAESARARWRAITAPHLVALVRSGARFERGVLIEREQEAAV